MYANRRSIAVALTMCLLTTACVTIGTRRAGTLVHRPGGAKMPGDERTTLTQGPQLNATQEATWKRVKDKDAPATLIAEDGMRCTVTEKKFNDTKVGDTALCQWTQ